MAFHININFEVLSAAFQKHVREKARRFGSTIVYKENNQLIEEDPKTCAKKVLKNYSEK
jgi:hypothetical protein